MRELGEEAGAKNVEVWDLQHLRPTKLIDGERKFFVRSFALDATRLELNNTSLEEHCFMGEYKIDNLLALHKRQVARSLTRATFPPALLETITNLSKLQNLPLDEAIKELQQKYAA